MRSSDLDLELDSGVQQPLEKSEAKIWLRVGTTLSVVTRSLRSVLGTQCHVQQNAYTLWDQLRDTCQHKLTISSIYQLLSQLEHYFKSSRDLGGVSVNLTLLRNIHDSPFAIKM